MSCSSGVTLARLHLHTDHCFCCLFCAGFSRGFQVLADFCLPARQFGWTKRQPVELFDGDVRRGPSFLSQEMHRSVTTNILLPDTVIRCREACGISANRTFESGARRAHTCVVQLLVVAGEQACRNPFSFKICRSVDTLCLFGVSDSVVSNVPCVL